MCPVAGDADQEKWPKTQQSGGTCQFFGSFQVTMVHQKQQILLSLDFRTLNTLDDVLAFQVALKRLKGFEEFVQVFRFIRASDDVVIREIT